MSIEFNIEGLDNGLNVERFRADWMSFTIDENINIVGIQELSDLQLLMIDAFCGSPQNCNYQDEKVAITNLGPPQAELEALFRGRARALAVVFEEHMNQNS